MRPVGARIEHGHGAAVRLLISDFLAFAARIVDEPHRVAAVAKVPVAISRDRLREICIGHGFHERTSRLNLGGSIELERGKGEPVVEAPLLQIRERQGDERRQPARVCVRLARFDVLHQSLRGGRHECAAVERAEPLERVDVDQHPGHLASPRRHHVPLPRRELVLVQRAEGRRGELRGRRHHRVLRRGVQRGRRPWVLAQPRVIELAARELRPETRVDRALPRLESQDVGAIGRHRRVGAGRDVFNSVRMVQTRPREKFLLRVPLNGCVSTTTRRHSERRLARRPRPRTPKRGSWNFPATMGGTTSRLHDSLGGERPREPAASLPARNPTILFRKRVEKASAPPTLT